MKKDIDTTPDAVELRHRAEQRLKAQQHSDATPDTEIRKLLHELQVHQIELEMQNEELQQARTDAETASSHYMELYDLAPIGYFTLDREGNILQANLTGAELLGMERDKLVAQRFGHFVDVNEHAAFRQFLDHAFAGRVKESCELALASTTDTPFIVHIDAVAYTSGQACRVMVTDITARKRDEEQMRIAAIVFSTVDEAVFVSESNNRIKAANPAFTDVTGYSLEEVIGKNPGILASGKHPLEFYQEMWQTLIATGSWQGEIWNRHKSGEIYVKWLSIKQVSDEYGQVIHYVATLSDITRRKAAEERMYHLAYYDALTDLPNRVLFYDRLYQALIMAQRDREQLAVMFLDLDGFKAINDNFGHGVGDILLKDAATRIRACMRESDTAARMGGDEFIILLPVVEGKQDATLVAEKIRDAIARPYELAGHSLHISSSIGIAVYPEHGIEDSTLINNADTAMYYAKQSKEGSIKLYGETPGSD